MLDKSGRNNHATQSVSAARPTYQVDGNGKAYLSFNGVDDTMVIPSAAFAYGPADVWAAYRYESGVAVGHIVRNQGTGGGQDRFQIAHGGIDFGATTLSQSGSVTGTNLVIGGFVNGTGTTTQGMYRSGIGTVTGSVTRAGMQTTFRLFNSFSEFTGGRYYGGLAIMRNLTEAERTNVKTYLAKRSGVTL